MDRYKLTPILLENFGMVRFVKFALVCDFLLPHVKEMSAQCIVYNRTKIVRGDLTDRSQFFHPSLVDFHGWHLLPHFC